MNRPRCAADKLCGPQGADVATQEFDDYYEILQISPTAEPEMIHRAYRLLAQRFHPDNSETGNAERFRQLTEAYEVVSDPERRARYDVGYARRRQERWRLVTNGADSENDFATEQRFRLTVLEVLYTRRRIDPESPGMSPLDIENLIGLTRDQQEFTIWYLVQKKYVTRNDSSMLTVTVDGVEYLESNYKETSRLRLKEAPSFRP
jgi:curved DNA-binding protein